MSDHVLMKDIDGKTVVLKISDLSAYFMTNGVIVYGMNIKTIAALRSEYIKLGGPINITPESVKETFNKKNPREL